MQASVEDFCNLIDRNQCKKSDLDLESIYNTVSETLIGSRSI
jgi:hypothetical protein